MNLAVVLLCCNKECAMESMQTSQVVAAAGHARDVDKKLNSTGA